MGFSRPEYWSGLPFPTLSCSKQWKYTFPKAYVNAISLFHYVNTEIVKRKSTLHQKTQRRGKKITCLYLLPRDDYAFFFFFWKVTINVLLYKLPIILCCNFCFVAQSCPTLWHPMDCSTPGFPVVTNSQSSLKLMSIESVTPSDHLILCHHLLLLPSTFPSIRVFSKWVGSSHQVTRVLELQHQSFQWIFRVDFL